MESVLIKCADIYYVLFDYKTWREAYALPVVGMGPPWPSIEHGHSGITAHHKYQIKTIKYHFWLTSFKCFIVNNVRVRAPSCWSLFSHTEHIRWEGIQLSNQCIPQRSPRICGVILCLKVHVVVISPANLSSACFFPPSVQNIIYYYYYYERFYKISLLNRINIKFSIF